MNERRSNRLAKLLVEVLKHQLKKQLGDEVVTVLASEVIDHFGEKTKDVLDIENEKVHKHKERDRAS